LEARLLEEFQVDRVEDLPIDLAGAQMIDQEANTNRLYDEIEGRVTRVKNRQNELIGGFQFASPYMAMRAVSSSLAATDRTHHFDFINSAENHRRQFVRELNVAEMKKQELGDSPEIQREFWAQITEFLPTFVSASQDVKRSLVAMVCIVLWAVVAATAALLVPPKINRMR
jgi:ABC-2 type transport system permease protein